MHQADEILLHIGFAKTGTTAIQRFLFANKDQLSAQGVLWPTSDDNHFHLRSIISDDAASQIQIRRLGLPEDRVPPFLADWADRVAEEIAATKPKRILFSTEYLNGAAPHELQRLAAFLSRFSPRVRVLAYVRDPWSMAISLTQENIRTGLWVAPVPLSQAVRFGAAINHFQANLGHELEVHAYQSDVISDFLEWTGIDVAYERTPRANRGMGLHTACVLAELNRLYPAFNEDGVFLQDHSRGWMAECIARSFVDEPPIRMTAATAASIEKQVRPDLDELQRRYFGGREVLSMDMRKITDEEDDRLHMGRLDSSVAAVGMLAAMRLLSDRALHYFYERQRLRDMLRGSAS